MVLAKQKWPTLPFGEVAEFKNGLNFSSKESGYSLKVLGVGDFQRHSTLDETDHLATIHTNREINSSYYLEKGDLVFVRSNGNKALVGRCLLIRTSGEPISYSGFTIRARITDKNLKPEFVNLLIQSGLLKRSLKKEGAGTNISNLNQGILSKLEVFVPTPEEQEDILGFFENFTQAIEKTEALIRAKQQQFGWLATKLIQSNKQSTLPLGKIAKIKKGKQLNRDTLDDSIGYPVWNGGITPSGYADNFNTPANTVTISEGGNSCGFVNYCTEQFWCGGHCYALENLSKKIDAEFLYYYLKSKQHQIMRLRVGSGLPNIQRRDLEKFEISLPPLPEQQRIANLLNTAQAEIRLLQQLAEKYRTQKRGLMQKLLTGEWRVGGDKEAAA